MATSKLLFALLIAASPLLTPVYAKTSDSPVFNIWAAQWASLAGQKRAERLPCVRSDQHACTHALSSAVTGAPNARHTGAVDPFARPSHTVRTTMRHVVYKNSARIKSTARQLPFARSNAGAFARSLPTMLLSDSGRRMLDVNLDQFNEVQPPAVETLADYVTAVEPNPLLNTTPLTDASGGLGDSAYVSLYDFDDGGAPSSGETHRGLQEITSLLDAKSTLAAATSVPEPGTGLLIGVGLMALLGRRRLERVGPNTGLGRRRGP